MPYFKVLPLNAPEARPFLHTLKHKLTPFLNDTDNKSGFFVGWFVEVFENLDSGETVTRYIDTYKYMYSTTDEILTKYFGQKGPIKRTPKIALSASLAGTPIARLVCLAVSFCRENASFGLIRLDTSSPHGINSVIVSNEKIELVVGTIATLQEKNEDLTILREELLRLARLDLVLLGAVSYPTEFINIQFPEGDSIEIPKDSPQYSDLKNVSEYMVEPLKAIYPSENIICLGHGRNHGCSVLTSIAFLGESSVGEQILPIHGFGYAYDLLSEVQIWRRIAKIPVHADGNSNLYGAKVPKHFLCSVAIEVTSRVFWANNTVLNSDSYRRACQLALSAALREARGCMANAETNKVVAACAQSICHIVLHSDSFNRKEACDILNICATQDITEAEIEANLIRQFKKTTRVDDDDATVILDRDMDEQDF